MSCKVITYTNPKALDQLSSFQPYTDVLHVCATKNMREGVYERYQKNPNSFLITAPIVSAVQLIESLIGEWYHSTTKLKQYLDLSEVIQNEVVLEPHFLSSFRRNQTEVLDTIRLLEFSGIKPDDFDEDLELTTKEAAFHNIWEKFEDNGYIQRIRKFLSSGIKDILTENWGDNLSKLVKEAYKDNQSILPKVNQKVGFQKMVLHGFYFMTPEQQQVFTLLRRAGVEIIFLNLYDRRFPESFSFIKKFINGKHGWVDEKEWEVEKWPSQKKTLADKFLADFEGDSIEQYEMPAHLKVIDFPDFYAFLKDYESNLATGNSNERKTYLAPNAASLNDRLQEYYPEQFKAKRHFLGYPIGQFLYQLHQMWSEEDQSLIITETGLFECFASGWLYDEKTKKNARSFTRTLQDVMPFFQECVTKDSWKKRARKLLEIEENVLSAFEKEEDDCFQKRLSSPFPYFSQFTVSKKEVEQVVAFIKMIFDIAYDLFEDGKNRISLSDHFSRLRKLLESSNPYLEKEIEKEEKILINQLKETLQTTPDVGAFHVNDISTAISLYLSGHLKKDHEEDELIRPFIEIDGEAFKQRTITHVTGLDENSLPYSEFKLPWPLTNHVFKTLAQRNIPLSLLVLRNESVKEITRYLLYNLLQFTNCLELSWMVQLDDKKNLDKAIYLSQLGLEPNVMDTTNVLDLEDIKLKREIPKQQLDSFLAYPIDALAEFTFCPRRFYYSYLSGNDVSFQTEFVQEFLFGNLLKAVGALLPTIPDDKIKEEVYKLFPYWNEFKCNLIGDENIQYRRWAKNNFGGYTPFGESEKFSDLRKLFLFPVLQNSKGDEDSKRVAEAIDQLYKHPDRELPSLREEFEKQLVEHPIQMEAIPSGKCRFCPHNGICPDAFHPIDDGERKRMK